MVYRVFVEKKKEQYEDAFKFSIALGVGLCIMSSVPLWITCAFTEKEYMIAIAVDILLIFVAAGVFLIVKSVITMDTYHHLLEEGDYTQEKKAEAKKNKNLSKIYWYCVVAIYLLWSFVSSDWYITWIIWPVAGVFFGAVCALANMVRNR